MSVSLKLDNHPCFNDKARHEFGRIHLPVARSCNIQCRYCNRKYDCVSEGRPGVSSAVLTPPQALLYLHQAMKNDQRIKVVGIAGPGDPLADAAATMETLARVRDAYPEMLLCLATNGLNLPEHADELARLRVSHVTVTVNAVDPAVGERIYSWVRPGKFTLRQKEGAALLLARKLEGISRLKERGVTIKINTVVVPGVNDEHVAEIARKAAALGADIMNCVPLYPVAGSLWEDMPAPPPDMIGRIRLEAGKHLPQMEHCARCRADAAGLVGETTGEATFDLLKSIARPEPLSGERPYVAVATMEEVLVNQHLGAAASLSVYERQGGGFRLVERRATPPPGDGDRRWEALARTFSDCRAILAGGIGQSPKRIFASCGLQVIEMEGLIEEALLGVYEGRDLSRLAKKTRTRCGSGCGGDGRGCG